MCHVALPLQGAGAGPAPWVVPIQPELEEGGAPEEDRVEPGVLLLQLLPGDGVRGGVVGRPGVAGVRLAALLVPPPPSRRPRVGAEEALGLGGDWLHEGTDPFSKVFPDVGHRIDTVETPPQIILLKT